MLQSRWWVGVDFLKGNSRTVGEKKENRTWNNSLWQFLLRPCELCKHSRAYKRFSGVLEVLFIQRLENGSLTVSSVRSSNTPELDTAKPWRRRPAVIQPQISPSRTSSHRASHGRLKDKGPASKSRTRHSFYPSLLFFDLHE